MLRESHFALGTASGPCISSLRKNFYFFISDVTVNLTYAYLLTLPAVKSTFWLHLSYCHVVISPPAIF